MGPLYLSRGFWAGRGGATGISAESQPSTVLYHYSPLSLQYRLLIKLRSNVAACIVEINSSYQSDSLSRYRLLCALQCDQLFLQRKG